MLTLDRALARGLHSPAVLAKGERLLALGFVRPDPEYPDVFWVRSGSGGEREYRVQLHEHFASCSCKHGIHAGSDAVCAHPVAAMAWRKSEGLETEADKAGRRPAEEGGPGLAERIPSWKADEGELPEVPF